MNHTKKLETIQSLQLTLQRNRDQCFILRFRGQTDQVEAMEKKNEVLNDQINRLVTEAMQDWSCDAGEVTAQIKKANSNLKRAITGIEKEKKQTENIAKAMGIVDEIIAIAKSLLRMP